MKIYNTMSRKKEDLIPIHPGKINMYVCGPTVYDHIHFGNARTFISFDTIRRYLEWKGFDVAFVQNITDVDDKIINRANKEGRTFEEVATEYTKAFVEAMDALGIKAPTARPKATESIPEMIELIEDLIERGHAYAIDGDVYFSVRSYPEYGKLSGRNLEDMRSGARVGVDERKKDPLDFALWKSAKPGEPKWDSPWGEGRPGWHIECSVMSEDELGLPFDIHGGGSDLIFPHHENELAQSEAGTGLEFSRYWMHGGMLLIDKEKMSKSEGNFLVLKDVLEAFPTPVIRMFLLQTHYRSPLDYVPTRLEEAKHTLERAESFVANVEWAAENEDFVTSEHLSPKSDAASKLVELVKATRSNFEREMDDDFNTAGALGSVFELIREGNSQLAAREVNDHDLLAALIKAAEMVKSLFSVLGIELRDKKASSSSEYPKELVELASRLVGFKGVDGADAVKALLDARAKARAEKDWGLADGVRDGLMDLGFVIEDTLQGARLKRA